MSSFASSSSSTISVEKYDVFISFRGEDTRCNFISHLHAALHRQRIETFIDNIKVEKGEEISPSLLSAIQESKISLIVFSERYATSKWCLEELVKIIECKKKYGQIVIPIFYQVDPTDVRHQTGTFADAFAEYEKHHEGRIKIWRAALKEAADLSGFDSTQIRNESTLIMEVVKKVLKRLNNMSQSDDDHKLIGMTSRIQKIEALLCKGSMGVFSVGIWGICGVGKTTLASAVLSKISSQFEVSYFIRNVRERLEERDGFARLEQEFLHAILEDENMNIATPNLRLSFTKRRLGRKKVVIVFDDVSDSSQIQSLIGDLDMFHSGSRFIITTRDKQVLNNCKVDKIYEVEELFDEEALQLFSQHAFGQNHPTVDYTELSKRVVKYAKGLPLALKVLGSSLVDLDKQDWESALDKLERTPPKHIQEVLKISYDGLDDEQKNIFLDVACFLNGEDTKFIVDFLDVNSSSAMMELKVLIKKSLITIAEDNTVSMHDLLRKMGKKVVQQESRNVGERSRLWHHKDIYSVLTNNTGTGAIEAISLDMSKMKRKIDLNPNAFSKMHKLRFLKLYSPCKCNKENANKVDVSQDLKFVMTQLRYFHWDGCPLKSLSSILDPDDLVRLVMPHSNLQKLWDDDQHPDKLKHIDLSNSKGLIKFPDLSGALNLESLILKDCTRLCLLHTLSSLRNLKKLVTLDLSGCKRLKLANYIKIIDPVTAGIAGAAVVAAVSVISITQFSIPVVLCVAAANVAMKSYKKYKDVEQSVGLLVRELSETNTLTYLSLNYCKVKKLPSGLGQLSSLRDLCLKGNKFKTIPGSIISLSNLFSLDLSYCKKLRSLPEFPKKLSRIEANFCMSLETLSPGLSSLFTNTCTSSKDRPRFSFINCCKLNQNTLPNIGKEALEKIYLASKEHDHHEEIYYEHEPCGFSCFPGNEIPRWFTFQNPGSHITIEIPSDRGNKCISFALCTVVTPSLNQEEPINNLISNIGCAFKLKQKDGQEDIVVHDALWGNSYNPDSTIDHVYMGYNFFHGSVIGNIYSNKVSFEFYLEDLQGKPCTSFQVAKCGVQLM